MRKRFQAGLLLLGLALGGCMSAADKPPPPTDFLPIKGVGTVREIHADLQYLILTLDDKPQKAWWNEHSRFYEGRTQVHSLSLVPGDHIRLVGIIAFHEIYIQQLIQVRN